VETDSAWSLGGRRVKRAIAALVAVSCVFVYAVAATGNAHAASGPLSAPASVVPGVSGASAGAAGADDQALNSLAPADSSAPSDQTAATNQAANAAASALQQAARNIVVSIRINSPGDDGPIQQTNTGGAVGSSSNDSATGQEAGQTGQPGGNEDASTNQAAGSDATATQNDPQNIVISIRVNSPGDNGPVSQQNISVAVSSSGNVSITNQGAGVADGGEATGGSPSGTTGNLRGSLTPMRHASVPAGGTGGGAPAASRAAPKHAAASTGSGSTPRPAAVSNTSHAAGPSAPVRVVQHAAMKAKTSIQGAARPLLRAAPRYGADVLKQLAPRPPAALQSDNSGPNVSNAVLLTLVAVLGAFAVLFSSSLIARAGRVFDRRAWRLR